MTPKGEPFLRVNRSRPCPVCGKPDWCKVASDGEACLCARVESGDRRGDAGWLHKLREAPVPKTRPKPPKRPAGVDWQAEAERYARNLLPAHRVQLARHLGLPDTGVDCFPLLGRGEDKGGKFVAFPEVNGAQRVVGLCRRYADGSKFQLPDGNRGLSVPAGFEAAKCRVVYVVEGPTDTAAMWCAGLTAVGRPSNMGGWEMLTALLHALPDACRVVVVGENDAKDNHDWPGLHGAAVVADHLAASLQRRPAALKHPVTWALCPDGVKDVRAWLTGCSSTTLWAERGRVLAESLDAAAVPAEPVEKAVRRLLADHEALKRRMAAVEAVLAKLSAN